MKKEEASPPEPKFFPTPADFRDWLEAHHASAKELWVGFYKKDSGKPSITWPESVDEALCVGWIDGIRKSLGAESYVIRFTPRKATSNWSAVNMKRMAELQAEGRVRPAGRAAFEQRSEAKSGIYAYEQRHAAQLKEAEERELRANEKAWDYFQGQAPGYRKLAIWWVVTAKREETRRKRLSVLIECSANERRIPSQIRPGQSE